MATVLGLTNYATGVQMCFECGVSFLKSHGLLFDEIHEMLGLKSASPFSRMWRNWPVRYQEGKEYRVFLSSNTGVYEYTTQAGYGTYALDMSSFTSKDIDKPIYIGYDDDHNPIASSIASHDNYALCDTTHYVTDQDYNTIVRLLDKACVNEITDISPITDEYETRGEMLLCEHCHKIIIEEATIECYECHTVYAHGRVAYTIEYGNNGPVHYTDELEHFDGLPRYLRLCMSCELEHRDKIERAIITALRAKFDETKNPLYADYAFSLVLDKDYQVLYREEDELCNKPDQCTPERIAMIDIIEKAFYNHHVYDIAKYPYVLHEIVDILKERYREDD